MADVDDLWYEDDPDNPGKKRPSPSHGKGKRYLARWRDPSGRQRKKRFARKRDAQDHLAQVTTSKAAGTYVDAAAGKIIFERYAETWRAARTHDPATARRIEYMFRLHVYEDPKKRGGRTPRGGPAIGHREMGWLAQSPSAMQAWIKGLKLSANSARVLIRDVGQVFNAAVDDAIIPRNPLKAKSVQRPAPAKHPALAWTADEVFAIDRFLPDHMTGLAIFGGACGHRQGELFGMDAGDLNFLARSCRIEWQLKYVGKELYFAPLKNENSRTVPVADAALLAMARHMELFPPVAVTLPVMNHNGKIEPAVTRKLVFTRPDGRPHTRQSGPYYWDRAREAAGIPTVKQATGMHVLRHTAATTWLANGLSIAKVAALLGDTQETILAAYSHVLPNDDDRAREIMNDFLDSPAAPPAEGSAQNVPLLPAAEG